MVRTLIGGILADEIRVTVTDDVKLARHVFDAFDLNNNVIPTDFAEGSTVSGNVITLDNNGIQRKESYTIGVGLTITTAFITPGAEIAGVTSVLRTSDNAELWSSAPGTFTGYTITLSGVGAPVFSFQLIIS